MVDRPNQSNLRRRRALLDRLLRNRRHNQRDVRDSRASSDEKDGIVLLRTRIVSIRSFDADGDRRSLADRLLASKDVVRKRPSDAVLDPEDKAELVVVVRRWARNVAHRERVALTVQPGLREEVGTPEGEVAMLAGAPGSSREGDVEEDRTVADCRSRLEEGTAEDEARVEEAGEVANDAH